MYGPWRQGFLQLAGRCGAPALAVRGVVRLKGSAAGQRVGAWWSGSASYSWSGSASSYSWWAARACESHPSPAQRAGTVHTGCLPSCIAFQVLVLSPGFPLPSAGLGCPDKLNFFMRLGWMASHLHGGAMPCSFWPTRAPDV